MEQYSKAYLDEIVETQGKLFDYVASNYSDKDTEDFIHSYMKSKTRQYIDEAQAYVLTLNYKDLLNYFIETDSYEFKDGNSLKGFLPDWIGEFYAYYGWFYNIPSSNLMDKISLDYLKSVYKGLHDLELELAIKKVGRV